MWPRGRCPSIPILDAYAKSLSLEVERRAGDGRWPRRRVPPSNLELRAGGNCSLFEGHVERLREAGLRQNSGSTGVSPDRQRPGLGPLAKQLFIFGESCRKFATMESCDKSGGRSSLASPPIMPALFAATACFNASKAAALWCISPSSATTKAGSWRLPAELLRARPSVVAAVRVRSE